MSLLDLSSFDDAWNDNPDVIESSLPTDLPSNLTQVPTNVPTTLMPSGLMRLDCPPPLMPAHLKALTDKMLESATVTPVPQLIDAEEDSMKLNALNKHFLSPDEVASLTAKSEDTWAVFEDSYDDHSGNVETDVKPPVPRNPFQDMLPMCSPEEFMELMAARLRRRQESIPVDERLGKLIK